MTMKSPVVQNKYTFTDFNRTTVHSFVSTVFHEIKQCKKTVEPFMGTYLSILCS